MYAGGRGVTAAASFLGEPHFSANGPQQDPVLENRKGTQKGERGTYGPRLGSGP